MSDTTFISPRSRDTSILLLAAIDSLGLEPDVLRTRNGGYEVPLAVADEYADHFADKDPADFEPTDNSFLPLQTNHKAWGISTVHEEERSGDVSPSTPITEAKAADAEKDDVNGDEGSTATDLADGEKEPAPKEAAPVTVTKEVGTKGDEAPADSSTDDAETSGVNTDEKTENPAPAKSALVADWVDFAKSKGYDESEGLTKDQLIAKYGA